MISMLVAKFFSKSEFNEITYLCRLIELIHEVTPGVKFIRVRMVIKMFYH